MRQLKNLTWMQGNIDVSAIKEFSFDLCCVDFFWNVQSAIRSTIPEYASTMHKLTGNKGLILCPDCLVSTLQNKDSGMQK